MVKLTWVFLLPFLAALAILISPRLSAKNYKRLAVLMSLIPLAMLLTYPASWLGLTVRHVWLPPLAIDFYLMVDRLSLFFLYLTALIIPISLLSMRSKDLEYPKAFYGLILFLQGLLIGFFTARDLMLFTIFWEAMLLPLYFLISLWGGVERRAAALKFLIYMLAGSALMVAAVLALYLAAGAGAFDFAILAEAAPSALYARWILAIFVLAFAVKTPLFPFHAWLSDAYYEAPTAGTILLSAILSKAGIYGLVRIGFGFFPDLMQAWSLWLLGFAITGVLYGGLAAWMQMDYKRLIAYSSFSHVNFILVGLFIASEVAQTGAILQALNHGITIAALFLAAGWLEERMGNTEIGSAGGLAKYMPQLCWLTLFFVLSSVALPGTNNFIGELFILFGLFGASPWATALLGTTVILSVAYMLRWLQLVYFGTASRFQERWKDIKSREIFIALPLVLLILWIGIYPTPLVEQIEQSKQEIQP